MLIEFKVANFRSFRDQQTFSLVADPAEKNLPDCLIQRDLPHLKKLRFLKGAAIYGANASGKSNLLEAIRFLADFVRNSATRLQPGDPTGTQPFKLDPNSCEGASQFEISFVVHEVRYRFGLELTPRRVLSESLHAFPKGSPRLWYHRRFIPDSSQDSGSYQWEKGSPSFARDLSLQAKTRENALFLSVAPQFNHPQLTSVYNWFKFHLRFLSLGALEPPSPSLTLRLLEQPEQKRQILNLLQSADIGISGASLLQAHEAPPAQAFSAPLAESPLAALLPKSQAAAGDSTPARRVCLEHLREGQDPIPMDFATEESSGTRRLFALAGIWADLLAKGDTLFLDEIETSLHPLLVKELLVLLFQRNHEAKGAQVIFTTHNPVLLDPGLLRRDQIWFTEKTPDGASHLYPLTDFQPRRDEALALGYLAGRYGAIPFLNSGLSL